MLFNSTEFAIFFPVVTAAFFAIPHRFRWAFLLAASYFFYMCWKPGYVVLILISTAIDYTAGLFMGCYANRRERLPFLILSLCSNLGMLGFFKYYNFFNNSLQNVLASFGLHLSLPENYFLLPVGISFYTFQSLSYIFEVYRGNQSPEKHLGRFALYVAFFPQLVAGPIERPGHLLPQFRLEHRFDYDRVVDGLRLMAWGLFKKVVIADRLAQLVDTVYNHPDQFGGEALTLASIFFAFQIFCDFSGYSDIAIGTARVLGFNLMNNFNRPYFAESISDFWRRWHISLSTWFRDYLYIPLGGSRTTSLRCNINLLIVFLVSGLWHGADWKFVTWGGLHGLYMVMSHLLKPLRERVKVLLQLDQVPWLLRVLRTTFTFLIVCYAWVFFRANSFADALYITTHFWCDWSIPNTADSLRLTIESLGMTSFEFTLALTALLVLVAGQVLEASRRISVCLTQWPMWFRWVAYSTLMWSIFLFGVFRHKEFIYFTF